MVRIRQAHVAHHHQRAGDCLHGLVPSLVVERLLGRHRDLQFQRRVETALYAYGVVVDLTIFQLERLAVFGLCRNDKTLAVLAVLDLHKGVGQQRYFLLEALLVLGKLRLLLVQVCALPSVAFRQRVLVLRILVIFLVLRILLVAVARRLFLEPVVCLLQERHMVIELLHVEGAVKTDLTVVADGVAQRRAVFKVGATHPVVGGGVLGVGVHPVEDGYEVERQLVGSRERLVIVERRSEMLDARPHRVFPCLILVGIEVLVHRRVGFLYFRVRGALEVHVQVLREVPA